MKTSQSNRSNEKVFLTTFLIATQILISIGLVACNAKITAKTDDNSPLDTPTTPIETDGTWASACNSVINFGYSERNVFEFSGTNVKHDNYRYADSACTELSYERHKIGDFSFGRMNSDSSYEINYAFPIGQGVKQLFYDVIKRDGDNLYFGEPMASGEAYRLHAVNMNQPYTKVASGYKPPASLTAKTLAADSQEDFVFLDEVRFKNSDSESNNDTISNLTSE